MRAKSTGSRGWTVGPLVTKSKPPAVNDGGYKIHKTLSVRKQPRLCYTMTSTPKATGKKDATNLTPVPNKSLKKKDKLLQHGPGQWRTPTQGRLSLDSEETNGSPTRLLNDLTTVSGAISTPVTKRQSCSAPKFADMPSNACTSPIADSVSPNACANVSTDASPPLRCLSQLRSESHEEESSPTGFDLRRRSSSFDGQPCPPPGRVDAIMIKVREALDEESGPAAARRLASVEFDVHNVCLREQATRDEAAKLRSENHLLKRRLDSLRRCIEEEQNRTENAKKGLQLELFRTQEELVRAREENDSLKKRLHEAQLSLEEVRITNARLATRRPLADRNRPLSTGDANARSGDHRDTEQMLVQSVCRLLLELRLEHPRSRLHHRSTALKDIFRVLDILPSHCDDEDESVSTCQSPPPPPPHQPTSDRMCLSLTERNLSEHEKHYSRLESSNSDHLSVCGEENSDSCSTVVPQDNRFTPSNVEKNSDSYSVTSRLTSSTLSSLQSVEDQRFREGLAKLDAHILRLQAKFNRNASTPYPRRFL